MDKYDKDIEITHNAKTSNCIWHKNVDTLSCVVMFNTFHFIGLFLFLFHCRVICLNTVK